MRLSKICFGVQIGEQTKPKPPPATTEAAQITTEAPPPKTSETGARFEPIDMDEI